MPGPPYAGGLERLIRIHKNALDIAIRRVALQALAVSSDQTAVVAYLRQVAIDPQSADPYVALFALDQAAVLHSNTLARPMMRELWEKKLVKDATALQILEDYARAFGWIRP
jgi:hypothetical protein